LGAWALGAWALGGRQGRPRVPPQKGVGSLSHRRFRVAPARTPPLDLAAAALEIGVTKAPGRRLSPEYPTGSRRGPNGAHIRRHRGAEEIFLGVGCSI
jgi:hypothetical protein